MLLGVILFAVGTGVYASASLGRGSYEVVNGKRSWLLAGLHCCGSEYNNSGGRITDSAAAVLYGLGLRQRWVVNICTGQAFSLWRAIQARLMAERIPRRGARLMLWSTPTPKKSLPS